MYPLDRVKPLTRCVRLTNIFAAGEHEYHSVGNDRRLRHIQSPRDPGRPERRSATVVLNSKRHEAACRSIAIRERKRRSHIGMRGSPGWREQPTSLV